ncbi:hypothetical protein ABEF95_012835 [Exophiala dermatitidis]
MASGATLNYTRVPNEENEGAGRYVQEERPNTEPHRPALAEGTPSLHGRPSVETQSSAAPIRVETPRSMEQPILATTTRPVDRLQDVRQHSSLSSFRRRFQTSIRPSWHEVSEKDTSIHGTTTEYRHSKQRNRLLRLTIGEWVNTLILCASYFGILYAYSRKLTIDVPQRKIFNALTTGNTLLLGVNLAASLRSYAKLVRWRLLAVCYRPLLTFDLIMGCGSLMNVVKLLWKARNSRSSYLPSKTQILCLFWLLVHLAIAILVGIIGLNYNLDTSQEFVLTRKGPVSILNLNALDSGNYMMDLSAVQQWGVRGEMATALPLPNLPPGGIYIPERGLAYFSSYLGHTSYFFKDFNANKSTGASIVSTRYINATAYCNAYKVVEGQYGNLSYIIYNDGHRDVNQSLPARPGPAGLLFMSMLNSSTLICPSTRCVDIRSFQAQTLPSNVVDDNEISIPEARFFQCNNTVTQVKDRNRKLSSNYSVSDVVARMLAGAIGWSDNPPVLDGQALSTTYTNSSSYRFNYIPREVDMARAIASFTMGAIAIMDVEGRARKNVSDGEQPVDAQILHVTWEYAGTILVLIPFIHFVTLMAVIIWANKAIIKDDSLLAIAKAYHTLLLQLGDGGCLLRGEQIVRALDNPLVVYGWSRGRDEGGPMHVDVFEGDPDHLKDLDPFMEGLYGGDDRTGRASTTAATTNTYGEHASARPQMGAVP